MGLGQVPQPLRTSRSPFVKWGFYWNLILFAMKTRDDSTQCPPYDKSSFSGCWYGGLCGRSCREMGSRFAKLALPPFMENLDHPSPPTLTSILALRLCPGVKVGPRIGLVVMARQWVRYGRPSSSEPRQPCVITLESSVPMVESLGKDVRHTTGGTSARVWEELVPQ